MDKDENAIKTSDGPFNESENQEVNTTDTNEDEGAATSEPEEVEPSAEVKAQDNPPATTDTVIETKTEEPTQKKRPPKRTAILIGILVVVLLLAGLVFFLRDDSTSSNQANNQTAGTTEELKEAFQGAAITDIFGTVEYNTGAGWNAVETGTNLEESNQLRTLTDSRAVITLDDGSAIRLDSNTTITLTSLTVDEVVIGNEGGQVYTRVTESDSRTFVVNVGEDEYQALGTAYRTVNEVDSKGAEVYHSKVKTKDAAKTEKEIGEGEAFYTKHSDPEQVDKVSKLDLDTLRDDEFLKWNKDKDASEKEFSDKLGFIKDIDKPKPEPEPEPAPTPAPVTPDGISAWGEKTDSGVKVSWSVKGVDTSNGFKIAYSTKDTTPSYGEDSAKYVSPGESSKVISLADGNKWHFRVCAYKGDGKCNYYSNTVSVTAPYKEKEKVTRGTLSASLDGNTLSWSYSGKAPHGYKVAWNTTGSPEYGKDAAKLVSGTSLSLADKISEAGTYKVRVCAYTAGTETEKCVDYSNEITYTI